MNKKVLVISHMFPTPVNEVSGIFVHSQCVALQKQGIEVHVICPTPCFPFYPKWKKYRSITGTTEVNGVPVTYVPTTMIPGGKFFDRYGSFYVKSIRKAVYDLKKKFDFELIHAHAAFPDGYAGGVFAKELGVPQITSLHGSDIMVYPKRHPKIWARTQEALQWSNQVIAVSHSLWEEARKIDSEVQGRIIHNGFDASVFYPQNQQMIRQQLDLSSHAKILLFVGNLYPVKGPDVLLESFAQIANQDQNLQLIYVGDGNLRQSLQSRAEELQIHDRVTFVGRKPYTEVPLWLNGADLVVVPSLSEGLGSINMEAMGCHKPVVASRVGGIPEIVQDGHTGLLVERNSVEALTQGLRKILLDQPELLFLYGKQGYEVSCKLTWEQNAREVSEMYQDLCEKA